MMAATAPATEAAVDSAAPGLASSPAFILAIVRRGGDDDAPEQPQFAAEDDAPYDIVIRVGPASTAPHLPRVCEADLLLDVPVFKRMIATKLLEEEELSADSIETACGILSLLVLTRGHRLSKLEEGGDSLLYLSEPSPFPSTLEELSLLLDWGAGAARHGILLSRVSASLQRDAFKEQKRREREEKEEEAFASLGPCTCKPWPSSQEGVTVLEFFSGIGGMRLSLPAAIRGVPLRRITAFDCSDTVNDVYEHNFHAAARLDGIEHSSLRRVLIDGLKVADVQGADVWTMSPPCQPHTKTRGAHQLDDGDNRSRGLSHIMRLLRHCRLRPRFIVLENVAGFVDSNMLTSWKKCLRECGYAYKQYLLSPPDCCGVPNERRRFYMACESTLLDGTHSLCCDEAIHESLPPPFERAAYPHEPMPLDRFLVVPLSADERRELLVPLKILASAWSPSRLSIVSRFDRRTFCFTKGYGRLFDKASGSLLLDSESAEKAPTGPLAEAQHALDRSDLPSLHGHLRLFSPRELLLLFGFPASFRFAPRLTLHNQFHAIGNSVSVTVVRAVMQTLF